MIPRPSPAANATRSLRSLLAAHHRCHLSQNVASTTLAGGSTLQPSQTPGHVNLAPKLLVRNLLKSSTDLVKRSLGSTEAAEWAQRIDNALSDLQAQRKPTIAIYGDLPSGSRDIVTALLEEPLSNDASRRQRLVSRHDAHLLDPSPLLVCSAVEEERLASDALTLESAWLQSNNANILEVPAGNLSDTVTRLLSADHILVVVDNVRFLSQPHLPELLPLLIDHPRFRIILNRIAPSLSPLHDEAQLQNELSRAAADSHSALHPDSTLPISSIHTISSSLALEAIDAFRSGTSSTSIETYQTKQLASKFTQLDNAVRSILAADSADPVNEDHTIHQLRSASFLASRALQACQGGIDKKETHVMEGEERVKVLLRSAEDASLQAENHILGDAHAESSSEPEFVGTSISVAQTAVANALETRYQWWQLPWRVDDLFNELRTLVIETYARHASDKMFFFGGLLQSHQDRLLTQSQDALTFPSSSPFNSPILQNQLAQLRRLLRPIEPSQLHPYSLITPIATRREQLISTEGGVISHLYGRAQRLILQMYGIGFGSGGGAYLAVVADYLSLETALGLGALGVIGGVRWGVSRWESARKKFWKDWHRVRQGLARDLKTSVKDTLKTQVTSYPKAAAKGLEELVNQQKTILDQVNRSRMTLEHDIDSLTQRIGR